MPCDSGPMPSDWDVMHDKLENATRVACELAKLLPQEQFAKVSSFTANWIAEHWRLDRQREEAAKQEQERNSLAEAARKKLTLAEREALGIR